MTAASIEFSGHAIACFIRNKSETGAALELGSTIEISRHNLHWWSLLTASDIGASLFGEWERWSASNSAELICRD